jgi:hypothetical protein
LSVGWFTPFMEKWNSNPNHGHYNVCISVQVVELFL